MRLHGQFEERGCFFLDAPISGGARGAASGKLAVWVGGDAQAFARCAPLFDAIADKVSHLGPAGAGTVAKLTHNAAGFAVQAVVAEAFSYGVRAGLEPLALWEAIRNGALGRMRTFDMLAGAVLSGNYDNASFTLQLAHKDVGLAVRAADDAGVPMPLVKGAYAQMEKAMARGWGARDSQSFLLLQFEDAEVEIAVPRDRIHAVFKRDKG